MKFRNPFKKLKSDLTIESMSKLGSTSSTHDDSSSSIDDTRSTTTASSSPSKKEAMFTK